LLYAGAALGLLYAHRIFWTTAAAQLLYNLVLAASIMMFGGRALGPGAMALGVLLGASGFLLIQSAALAPVVGTARIRGWLHRSAARSGVRKGVRLGLPLLCPPVINLTTGIVALWSLSAEPVGTIAALGYAGKLMRMASLLPDVMATVLFPKFATMTHVTSRAQLRDLSTRAMRMALFMALPIAGALVTLRVPVVALLFRHGSFSNDATVRVGLLFGLFLAGMPAGILSVYLTKVLYALQDNWWPTYSGLVSVVIATLAMPPLAASFSAEGVAGAYACVFWMGAVVQAAVLHWKYAALGIRELAIFCVKIVPLSAAAAWLGGEATQFLPNLTAAGTRSLTLEILIGGSLVVTLYWLSALLLGVPEALELSRYLRWQTAPVLDRVRAGLRG
jgi:putative peptidoglycan lipid II flippase